MDYGLHDQHSYLLSQRVQQEDHTDLEASWVMINQAGEIEKLLGETIIYKTRGRIALELTAERQSPDNPRFTRKSDTGTAYITSQRIIYLPNKPTAQFKSFATRILDCLDSRVQSSWFGPWYWQAVFRPVPGGNIPPGILLGKLQLNFNDGGAREFHTKFDERTAQLHHVSQIADYDNAQVQAVNMRFDERAREEADHDAGATPESNQSDLASGADVAGWQQPNQVLEDDPSDPKPEEEEGELAHMQQKLETSVFARELTSKTLAERNHPASPSHNDPEDEDILENADQIGHMSDIRGQVTYRLMTEGGTDGKHSALFEIEWSPLEFLRSQYDGLSGGTLETTITLTGSDSDAQAHTCGGYLSQTWPSSGVQTLSMLNTLMAYPDAPAECSFSDGTTVRARLDGNRVIVQAFGMSDSIADLAEQLGWLSAALRSSKSGIGISNCEPQLIHDTSLNVDIGTAIFPDKPPKHDIMCRISVEDLGSDSTDDPSSTNGKCWHRLFKSSTVVNRYPTPARSQAGTGLDIPLDILVRLAQSQHIDTFDQKLFIKGFSTMLVPIRRIDDNTIQWHLLCQPEGDRISYLEAYDLPHLQDIDINQLMKSKHIVGWCKNAKIHTGNADALYPIDKPFLYRTNSPCVLNGAEIHTRGHLIPNESQSTLSHREIPAHISQGCDLFSRKVRTLQSKYVVLWDEEDERGWLVSGSSTLLHILRAYIRQCEHEENICLQSDDIEESQNPCKDDAISETLNSQINQVLVLEQETRQGVTTSVTLRDQLEIFISTLNKLFDQQYLADKRRSQLKGNGTLSGWAFWDLASPAGDDVLKPYMSDLRLHCGWVDLIKANSAVTLFGRFGEIIRPCLDGHDAEWIELPRGKCYLASSGSILNRIMIKHGKSRGKPQLVGDDVVWYEPNTSWECTASPSDSKVLQKILPLRSAERLQLERNITSWHSILEKLPENSAFIFDTEHRGRFSQTPVTRTNGQGGSFLGYNQPVSQQVDSSFPLPSRDRERSDPEAYMVGVVCALPKEALAVRALFDCTHEEDFTQEGDDNVYNLGRMCQHNVVVATLGRTGNDSAASIASNMARTFPKVKYGLMVGIGAGVPSPDHDVRLGDIVIGTPGSGKPAVVQYDSGKVHPHNRFQVTSNLSPPPLLLLSIVNSLRGNPSPYKFKEQLMGHIKRIGDNDPKYQRPGLASDRFTTQSFLCDECRVGENQADDDEATTPTPPPRRENFQPICRPRIPCVGTPHFHYGTVGTGNVVLRDAETRERLRREHGVLCIDMESAGVTNCRIPFLVIRGVSDYADQSKNDEWQWYAAAAAASHAKSLLSRVKELG